jgi:hypothetical protein
VVELERLAEVQILMRGPLGATACSASPTPAWLCNRMGASRPRNSKRLSLGTGKVVLAELVFAR